MSINKVILVGNLGKDPELRYTASGVPVATFSLATSERYKDKSGDMQDKTEWHNIVAWRQLAEICGKYLHKGKQVYIEGKIQTRKYQDRDGNDRYITEIVADQMQMLGSRGEEGGGGAGQGFGRQAAPRAEGRPAPAQQGGQRKDATYSDFEEPPFNPDDEIPF